MNKITKIGVSALCGSLASLSLANAGEFSVTGAAIATWTEAGSKATTGSKFGLSKQATFNSSGEMDNGWTWSAYAATDDFDDAGFSITSSGMTLNLTGMGSVNLGQDSGGAVSPLDDKMPSAYEETWDGITTGLHRVDGIADGSILKYTTEAGLLPMNTTLAVAYNNDWDHTAEIADGGQGNVGSAAHGSGWDASLVSSPVDGLTVGIAYSEIETSDTLYEADAIDGTYFATYAMGPMTVGYQQAYDDPQHVDDSSVEYYDDQLWGVSFQVNDNLSVSYGEYDSKKVFNGASTTDVTAKAKGWNAAYNIGGATIKLKNNKIDNYNFTTGSEDERTEVALAMAF
jgi:hypothetical protein